MQNTTTYKLCIHGPWRSGKSSIMFRYFQNNFSEDNRYTGVDSMAKEYTINDRNIKLEFWDRQSCERFRALPLSYIVNSDAFIFPFDLTSYSSYKDIKAMLEELQDICNREAYHNPIVYLIGNKSDLEQDPLIKDEEVQSFVDGHKMYYIKVSCKTGNGFERLHQIPYDLSHLTPRHQSKSIKLTKPKRDPNKIYC
ncbi:Rab GTPase [Tieghemostelium lacteum]|uniref:Rab GTPase n=1 Tax=Tieghemostelium lacteum TaxID=361077 RepID=A0A151Z480_TIELA|nr:Rab GTPase [Tieghemostelium lacteum]|eukprot:KYQ88748.1 Rab GTPase [Tieghemostelium lacteum]